MTWYLAKIVYRIICGDGNHTSQFDEQLRLIEAGDENEALLKAVNIGRQEEETFFNKKEQLVRWQFVNVSELHVLSHLIDGAELYSQIKETEDGESYSRFIHHKAKLLYQASAVQTPSLT